MMNLPAWLRGASRRRACAPRLVHRPSWAALAVALSLSGCASWSERGVTEPLHAQLSPHLADAATTLTLQRDEDAVRTATAQADALLQAPLDAEGAVRVALLLHRGLQVRLHALGVSEAERVQAVGWPNPRLSVSRLARGSERETEWSLGLELGHWLLRPWISDLEDRRLAAERQQVALAVLEHLTQVRQSYYQAVAAEHTLRTLTRWHDAADTGATLARRLEQAGNFSPVQRAREQVLAAEGQRQRIRARLAAQASRERLARDLGLGDRPEALRLPEQLPELPKQLPERPELERQALAERLDVAAARQQLERRARELGAGRLRGFVNGLELSAIRSTSNEAPTQTGWEVSFELPLFDWGGARAARAEVLYGQNMHLAAQIAQEARSQVREAEATWRGAWQIARQYQDELLPLAREVSRQNLLRYNGMLIGPLDLLADARNQMTTITESIQAQRDFWLAQTVLDQALRGPVSPMSLNAANTSRSADAGANH
ncbi:MAG: hypothetical protein RLZZ494_1063 [Pseudomonadota bacterium]